MPYTDDPANSDTDQVRFLVGDTSTTSSELTDNEVLFLLADESGNAKRAAARAAEVLAAKYSKAADEKQVGPLRLSYTEKAQRYLTLAKSLWSKSAAATVAPYAGGISVTDKSTREADTDRTVPFFSRGMMDYPTGTEEVLSDESS